MATAKKLPSGSWRIRIGAGEGGKTVSFTAPTKKEAEIKAAEYLTGKRYPERRTIRECAEEFIESRENMRSPTTVCGYRKIVKNNMCAINDTRLCDLTQRQLQRWVDGLCKTLSPKSVKNIYGFVRSVIFYATDKFDYKISLPKNQKPVIILPAPEAIINVVRGTEIELPCMMAIWLGMRMSEIRAVRKSDIRDGVLTIQDAVVTVDGLDIRKHETKTHRARRIRVPDYILSLIDDLPPDQDEITKLSGQAIYKRFSRLLEVNNIPHIRFHDLRHLNASVMAKLKIPERYAMERGGWSTPQIMRDVYQHTFSDETIAVANKMDAYFDDLIKR